MSDKKVILVTGCTSGIGYEVSKYLFETGYEVLLVARNEESLGEKFEIKLLPYYICDLEKTEDIKGIFDYCRQNDIKLSGMVHCAGVVSNAPIRAYNIEDADREITLHYLAFVELCRNFYSKKISCEGSSIVALSSLASVSQKKGSVVYSASKSALNSAVSVASKEFLRRNIRVNAILPAYVKTRMTVGLEEITDVNESQPMGMIPAKEVAYLAEFLLSDKSQYITGALIPISAGMEV